MMGSLPLRVWKVTKSSIEITENIFMIHKED